jgi:hypothetical protein
MKNRRSLADVLGLALGAAAILLTAFALIYVIGIRPVHRAFRAWVPRHMEWGGPWEREEATEEVEGSFRTLSVTNVSGPVQVEGWSENHIQVRYEKQARGRQALEDFKIEIEKQGDTLKVRPEYPVPAGALFGSVSFHIKVPANLKEIQVHNVSGQIQVQDLAADVAQELETVSGAIVTERSGDLRIKSTSGSIDFSFAGGALYARSISGRISGRILGLESGGSADLESVSGAIEVEAYSGLEAVLRLSSVSGSISCDFPVQITEKREHRLEGRIGQGSVPLNIKTVSGSIRLKKAS